MKPSAWNRFTRGGGAGLGGCAPIAPGGRSAFDGGIAWAICGWQNHFILDVVNQPLEDLDQELLGPGAKPISFGVTEQFTTTLMVSAYAALLLALPFILYQIYAFVLPAFSPTERRVALPLLLMVPVLFICGVVFCYFVVLEPATEFLLGFNADEFTTAVRARDYYSFVALTTIAMGLVFQVPVVILALTRLRITTPEALRRAYPNLDRFRELKRELDPNVVLTSDLAVRLGV